ncbi:hypothetical protein LJB88_05135 [Erysipelotrichaceae bacterium OttesenSCG-928-M19]|nr:hypothetical protein [Erysipelotrichaceae bacterium OttesenSCG-928-M19]
MKKRKKEKYIEQETINFFNEILPIKLTYRYDHLMIDGKYAKIGVIKSYPSTPPIFGAISKLAKITNVYVVQKNSPLANEVAINYISQKYKTNNINKEKSNDKSLDVQSGISDKKAQQLQIRMIDENEIMYESTTFIMWTADDKEGLKSKEDEVKNALAMFNATIGNLDTKQPKAHRSILLTQNNSFRGLEQHMLSSTLSKLFPFSYGERIDKDGIIIGVDANTKGLIMVDFFDRTKLSNGNIIIMGASGEGKSNLMKKILSWYIAMNYTTFSIDSENREYVHLNKKLGATNISFNGNYFINIMEFRINSAMLDDDGIDYDEDNSKSSIKPNYLTQATPALNHIAWLRDFFSIYKKDMDERTLDILEDLLTKFYDKCGLLNIVNLNQLDSSNYPTISDFYNYIETKYQNPKDEFYSKTEYKDLLIAFKSIAKGTDSILFNGKTNIPNAQNINFDIFDIVDRAATSFNAILFNIMTYIWNMITRMDGRKVVTMDELYLLVNEDNDLMVKLVKEMQKRIRKYNGITMLGTQNISDLLVPSIAAKTQPIISNASTKFLFFPGDDELDKFAKLLKCTKEELQLISKPKRGYCLAFFSDKRYYISVKKMHYEDALFGDAGGK